MGKKGNSRNFVSEKVARPLGSGVVAAAAIRGVPTVPLLPFCSTDAAEFLGGIIPATAGPVADKGRASGCRGPAAEAGILLRGAADEAAEGTVFTGATGVGLACCL